MKKMFTFCLSLALLFSLAACNTPSGAATGIAPELQTTVPPPTSAGDNAGTETPQASPTSTKTATPSQTPTKTQTPTGSETPTPTKTEKAPAYPEYSPGTYMVRIDKIDLTNIRKSEFSVGDGSVKILRYTTGWIGDQEVIVALFSINEQAGASQPFGMSGGRWQTHYDHDASVDVVLEKALKRLGVAGRSDASFDVLTGNQPDSLGEEMYRTLLSDAVWGDEMVEFAQTGDPNVLPIGREGKPIIIFYKAYLAK